MLFKIKLICPEVDGFLREYEIDSEATFLDLNKAILDSCHFPDDQMTSFYICSSDWERGMQITREDMSEEGDNAEDILEMAKTRLSEFIEDAGQNIEFVFDPFSDRSFYLAVRELIPGKNLKKARVVRSQGEPPQQIKDLDFSMPAAAATAGAGLDDDIFDGITAGYNDDELDLDGFEISDGEF